MLGLTNPQAFLGLAAIYGLIQFVPPFWLAVIGLTSVYIAPLVTSPRDRAAAHDASVRAQELANTAAEKAKGIAQDGKAKAQQTAHDAQGRIQNLAQSGKQTATDHSAGARKIASDVSSYATEYVRDLPPTSANDMNGTPNISGSATNNAKQYLSSSLPDTIAGGTSKKATQLYNSTADTVKQRVSDGVSEQINTSADEARLLSGSTTASGTDPNFPASHYQRDGISSLPGQSGGDKTDTAGSAVHRYAANGDALATPGIMDRPRGSFEVQ
jgi:hypothetical protein